MYKYIRLDYLLIQTVKERKQQKGNSIAHIVST